MFYLKEAEQGHDENLKTVLDHEKKMLMIKALVDDLLQHFI